jgi:hypothetical protein
MPLYEAVVKTQKTTLFLIAIGFAAMILSFAFLVLDFRGDGKVGDLSLGIAFAGTAFAVLPIIAYVALDFLEVILKPSLEEKGVNVEVIEKYIKTNPTLDGRFVEEKRLQDKIVAGLIGGVMTFIFMGGLIFYSFDRPLMEEAISATLLGGLMGIAGFLFIAYGRAFPANSPLGMIERLIDHPFQASYWSFHYHPLVDKQTNKIIQSDDEYYELYWEAIQDQEMAENAASSSEGEYRFGS